MSPDAKYLDPTLENSERGNRFPTPDDSTDPLAHLPRLSGPQVKLERILADWHPDGKLPTSLRWVEGWTSAAITTDRPEILWRPSGLRRPGLTVQLTAARLNTRLGLGIEIPLAHAVVDRLLGFDRRLAETRLQLTPVEWGVWSFLVLRALTTLSLASPGAPLSGPLAPADLTLDRVGPDPFDSDGLGPIVTIRWSVRLDSLAAAVRLWIPESVIQNWLTTERTCSPIADSTDFRPEPRVEETTAARGRLASTWCALVGTVAMAHGLRRLRVGGVLPLSDTTLSGTPASPTGLIDLVVDLLSQGGRFRIPTRAVENSGGRLLRIEGRPEVELRPRDPIDVNIRENEAMTQPNTPSASPATPAVDVPVTLTVELGRVNITLTQLADIKPGDVIELNRHSRAPVELTSNGRLVARGELVLIDTDLGVRVTSVFV